MLDTSVFKALCLIIYYDLSRLGGDGGGDNDDDQCVTGAATLQCSSGKLN